MPKTKRKSMPRVAKVDFDYIKHLLAQGYSVAEISEKTGRGHNTITIMKQSNAFNDYRRLMREHGERYASPTKTVPKQAVDAMAHDLPLFRGMDISELISAIRQLEIAILELTRTMAEDKIKNTVRVTTTAPIKPNGLTQLKKN